MDRLQRTYICRNAGCIDFSNPNISACLGLQIPCAARFGDYRLLDSRCQLTILGGTFIGATICGVTIVGNDPSQYSPVFRIDVSAEPGSTGQTDASNPAEATIALLHQVVAGQQRQNQLLEQLVQATVSVQKQRASELEQWKEANPRLARSCRRAAESLSRVQTEFLETLTEEIDENEENLVEGEYMLNEFVDRFGPRLAHLNGVLQVLAQLGSGVPNQQPTQH